MRAIPMILTAAAVLAIAGCDRPGGEDAPDSAFADGGGAATGVVGSAPILRDGLWIIESTDEDEVASTTTMCLNEAVQERMSVFGSSMTAAWCGNTTITRRPLGGWTSHADCSPVEGTDMAIDTEITGDLRSRFRSEMVITTNGEADAPTIAEGRYQGACPADMAPGDFVDDKGESGNLVELAAGMEAMGAMMKGMKGALGPDGG